MKIKLDESLTRRLQSPLRELGHDVCTVADEGLLGSPDREVARSAAREERMIFALDIGFADIRDFPPGSHPGIVVFRISDPDLATLLRVIVEFARRSDLNALAGCVVMVGPGGTRIRWPEKPLL